jgi:ANTAR domain
MVSQLPSTQVGFVSEILEAGSRVARLEAEIAQLKDALARRQELGVATGLLAQRFAITPERAWSLLVRLSQNCHIKVRDIARAMINAHCGRLSSAEVEIICAVESCMPDGVRLISSAAADQRFPSEVRKLTGLDTPRSVDHDRHTNDRVDLGTETRQGILDWRGDGDRS